jgi:hypothetical protein
VRAVRSSDFLCGAVTDRLRFGLILILKKQRDGPFLLLERHKFLMKNVLIFAMAITLLSATASLASDKTTGKDSKKDKSTAVQRTRQDKTSSAEQKGGALLTGSYIKQDVRQYGRITDGANPVIVLGRESIDRSGAADLRQVLIRHGGR